MRCLAGSIIYIYTYNSIHIYIYNIYICIVQLISILFLSVATVQIPFKKSVVCFAAKVSVAGHWFCGSSRAEFGTKCWELEETFDFSSVGLRVGKNWSQSEMLSLLPAFPMSQIGGFLELIEGCQRVIAAQPSLTEVRCWILPSSQGPLERRR